MSVVTQEWTHNLTMMQQTVMLTAIRGPDGIPKYGPTKMLLRWYRRCILVSSMEQAVYTDPEMPGGGSFTGPSFVRNSEFLRTATWEDYMSHIVDDYLRELDAIPHHFQLHFMHGVEILGYKHPDDRIRMFWARLYQFLVKDMHLQPETEEQLDERLGDNRENWLKHSNVATTD